MIYVALGANLPSEKYGPPKATLEAAIGVLDAQPIRIIDCSPFYESAPVPRSDQPLFVNAVVAVETQLPSRELMERLHQIEAEFGRVRRNLNEARPLDLDLIAYHDKIADGSKGGPVLPHPRMSLRPFVLLPLQDIAPEWRHPESGTGIGEMVKNLTSLADIRQL